MLNLSNVEFNFLWMEIKTVSVSSAFLAFRRTTTASTSATTESELAMPATAITVSRAATTTASTKEASPTAAITASAQAMLAIKASRGATRKVSTRTQSQQCQQ